MTYTAKETGAYSGHPIELYHFIRGGLSWRYTSADEDKVWDGATFLSYTMERTAFEQTQEMSRNPITITIDKDCPFVLQYRGSPPTDVIQLKVYRYHDGDTELTTPWIGRVTNVKFKERTAEIRCEPIYTSMKRPVLRRRYQTTCPHVLYGVSCGVGSASFAALANLTGINGTTISSATFAIQADGYYAGGYVDWEVNGNLERRFILSHTGSNIVLNLPFSGLVNGTTVRAYPGCDHLLATCNSKFNNVVNFGGQPFYPKKNPFGGSPIY